MSIQDFDGYYFLNYFFIYSFLGWVMECIVISIEKKNIVNRGFIRGPFCTIYGIGAMFTWYALSPVKDNLISLFVCGMLLSSLLEYSTAKVMTRLFGSFWWDYSKKPFNYKGILCLESTIAWGFITVMFFMILHPAVGFVINLYSQSIGKIVLTILSIYLCLDFSTSFYKAIKVRNLDDVEKLNDIDELPSEIIIDLDTLESNEEIDLRGEYDGR